MKLKHRLSICHSRGKAGINDLHEHYELANCVLGLGEDRVVVKCTVVCLVGNSQETTKDNDRTQSNNSTAYLGAFPATLCRSIVQIGIEVKPRWAPRAQEA